MSSLVLPSYKGLVFPFKRKTTYKTLSDTSVANQVANLALQQYPVHSYDLQYELLRDDVTPSEYRAIQGIFNACGGRFDSFLYLDPVFNSVTHSERLRDSIPSHCNFPKYRWPGWARHHPEF